MAFIFPCCITSALAEEAEGQPPVREDINFELGGYLTWWNMKVKDPAAGGEIFNLPNELTDENPRVAKSFALAHGKSYEVSLDHVNSGGWNIWWEEGEPLAYWYCWEAIVGGKPDLNVATFPDLENEFYKLGPRNDKALYFSIGANGDWLVDNTAGLLTRERMVLDDDRASNLKAHLLPVTVSGGLGVDSMSNTVAANVKGSQSKYWIMAPIPDAQAPTPPVDMTLANIGIPVSQALTLECTCPQVLAPGSLVIDPNSQSAGAFWAAAATETVSGDYFPQFKITKIGNNAANPPIEIRIPLGVKVMKRRTVKVALHAISSQVPGNPDHPPAFSPGKEALEKVLNEIYGSQLNVQFEVIPYQRSVPFDVADAATLRVPGFTAVVPEPSPGDGVLQYRNFVAGEYAKIPTAKDANCDLNIYVVGGGSPMAIYGPNENGSITANQFAVGDTDVENKVVIIDGDLAQREYGGKLFNSDASKRTIDWVMHSIAHEIGHVMIGAGHPDEGTGEAPLTGTDAKVRLMCTGEKFNLNSLLLVKSEWDKAEEWLKENPDKRVREQSSGGGQ